jgi:hypothetical protein
MSGVLWKPHEGPQTLILTINDVYECLFGGSRGGGKTDTGIVWMLQHADNPNFRGLVIRRNAQDLSDWLDRANQLYTSATITGKPAQIKFKSGAVIRTGHLKDADAYIHFQGHEYQRMLIEELTQIPNEESYLKLLSSCRSTLEGVKPSVLCTANPGGPGHSWVKRRFKIGVREPNKAFKDDVSQRYRVYVPATIEDNPTLKNADPDYVKYLDSLPEPLRSAWLFGDWNVFAGQYFDQWDPVVHIIDEEREKELGFGKHYNNKYIGIDWGYANPFACVWLEVTPDNNVMAYRELYGTEKHPTEWGGLISKYSQGENITMSYADPSMWIRNPMSWSNPATQMWSDKSIANAIMGSGDFPLVPNMVPANNSRVNGWRNIATYMSHSKKKRPNFFIKKGTCPNLIRTIPDMVRDEKNVEDIDTTLEDHIVDALRYAFTGIDAPAEPVKKKTPEQIKYEELTSEEYDRKSFTYNFGGN